MVLLLTTQSIGRPPRVDRVVTRIYAFRADGDNFQTLEPSSSFVADAMSVRFAGSELIREWSEPVLSWSDEPGLPRPEVARFVAGPVVTTEVRRVLERLSADSIEFLPVDAAGERRWAVNVVRVLDALDPSTLGTWSADRTRLLTVTKFRFVDSSLRGVFKVPQRVRAEIFVDGSVADVLSRVAGTRLTCVWRAGVTDYEGSADRWTPPSP